ncbi:Uncharacterised protein [Halioglobus japonicus]|nr:Uncharacterised protein [Halioglobus japonicus]
MSQSQIQSMPQDKFLLVAVNLLHKAFIEATRTEAKALYKQIVGGEIVNLTRVQLVDDSTATFQLSLSHSEFQGRLNFGAFRASVTALVSNIAKALREERELKVFNALNDGSAMIFGITAVTVEDSKPNVMVLATDSSAQESATVLQLMYLDPTQFASAAGSAPPEATA